MKAMSEKNRSWNEVIRDCFSVFDRNETGVIMKNDFEFVLRLVTILYVIILACLQRTWWYK